MMKQKIEKTADEKMWNRISRIPAVILVLLSGIDIVRFAILGDKTAFITFSMIAVTFMLVAYMAWKSKMPFLYLVIAAAAFVLYFNTNFSTSTYYFNWLFLVESIIAALGGILGIAVMIGKKIPVGRVAVLPLLAAVLILAGFLGFWKVRYEAGHEAQGQARDELWAVPAKYDAEESEQAGNIMSIGFEKAYALQTDMNLPASEILSTYVYRIGLLNGDYGYSTAVGLFNSVVNVILLVFVNWVVKKLNDGEGL